MSDPRTALSRAELQALLSRGDPAAAAIALPEDFGLEHAAALHARLAALVEAPGAVTLDGAGVLRPHTAGLQVLAAFVRTRAAAGHETRWREPSPELRGAAAALGLEAHLGLAAPESA